MNISSLVWREILHRKLGFAVGLVSVVIAVTGLTGALGMLQAHDIRTERIIEIKEGELREEMIRLEDDYRRIMRRLGYNVLILHRDQDIADLHARGYAATTFPEEWARKLAEGKIETLNHLLPVLQRRIVWPEQNREIMLTGIRGQVPLLHRRDAERSPITEPIPPGKVDIGEAIARLLDLSPGDPVVVKGLALTVNKRFPRRGNQDDNTLWIHLDQAQELLDAPGRINGILALECICTPEALGMIQSEIAALLPEAQVFEFASLVTVRAQARSRAAEAHRRAIDQEKTNREALRQQRENMASMLATLVTVGSMVWIMLLTFNNARERRSEIGILRAIGLRSGQIMFVFLAKAASIGLMGALAGYFAGLTFGALWGEQALVALSPWHLFNANLFIGIMLGAPLLSAAAAWVPAMVAAGQDPAHILREE